MSKADAGSLLQRPATRLDNQSGIARCCSSSMLDGLIGLQRECGSHQPGGRFNISREILRSGPRHRP
jgi:hypothetical protein